MLVLVGWLALSGGDHKGSAADPPVTTGAPRPPVDHRRDDAASLRVLPGLVADDPGRHTRRPRGP